MGRHHVRRIAMAADGRGAAHLPDATREELVGQREAGLLHGCKAGSWLPRLLAEPLQRRGMLRYLLQQLQQRIRSHFGRAECSSAPPLHKTGIDTSTRAEK